MQTILITGANRGIGLALTESYLAQGDQVIAVCRETTPELDATSAEIIEGIDVTSSENIQSLVSILSGQKLDILINNAGILFNEQLGDITLKRAKENITTQFLINALAPLEVTDALVSSGNLQAGSKVGIVTSRMGSITDNDSGGRYGYRMSKAAVNAAGKSLAIDLAAKDIAVALLHPGWVQTRMVGFGGLISPQESASGLVNVIAQLTQKNSGGFLHTNGETLPW
ncbi:SDR family oxidoreductase [Pelagibaculum spongiae]|uniref:Short-chain dehydrogenase n=1 Tax=Pelagibaculum spongiae TaxID=2080658 RepID=A0A2V1GV20_9GAMM|nr:SDR family oxidoreductase [Pelagibaculum spongiae]PVZ70188.1 short-chain dehydrogenase [Pelagibaculum spongiae]